MRTKEIQNGRLAMISSFAYGAQVCAFLGFLL